VLDGISVADCETLGREHNVQLEFAGGCTAGALVLASRRVVLDGVEVDHEVVLDGKDGVGREPRVVLGVDLGDDGLVVFVSDLENHVSRGRRIDCEEWKLTMRWM
jgi:hypothetical protein